MKESGLRSAFAKNLPEAQWTPIETGLVSKGVPDAEFCFPNGISGWIEFKVAIGNVVAVRPLQVSWIERRVRLGGRIFVVVLRNDELFLFDGSMIRSLKENGLKITKDGLRWIGSSRWSWIDIEMSLKHYEWMFRKLYSKKHQSERENCKFNLTIGDLIPPKLCPVCHCELTFGFPCSTQAVTDRFKPNGGYVKGNVNVICSSCNALKGNNDPKLIKSLSTNDNRWSSLATWIDRIIHPVDI